MGATSDSPLQMPARRFNEDEKQHRANNGALEQFGNIAFGAFVPIGGAVLYGGSAAPAGWLNSNGAAVNRRAYKELFSVYGTTFGPGDGVTTFNLPTLAAPAPFTMYIIRSGVY
jgi:hypothetical protein